MSINICVLGSSSSGNCTLIWNDTHIIMVDCGLPVGYTKLCMVELLGRRGAFGPDVCFITHAHSDHVNNAMFNWFKKENKTSIICQKSTLYELLGKYKALNSLREDNKVLANRLIQHYQYGTIAYLPFMVKHDSPGGCFGYSLYFPEEKKEIVIATDFGPPQASTIQNFNGADCAIIECNYDLQMLLDSDRDDELKKRIMETHCSNDNIGNLIAEAANKSKLKNIVLTHLSDQCNTQLKAKCAVRKILRSDYGSRKIPNIYVTYKRKMSKIVTL